MKPSLHYLLKHAVSQWFKDQVPRMGAALAFYTVFSLAPILILAIAVAGFIFGLQPAQNQMIDQIQQLIGPQSAQAVKEMLEASLKPASGMRAAIIGSLTFLFGATGALVELQEGLNRIWKVKTESHILSLIKQRLTSLALVAGIAFLLLVSLVISALLSMAGAAMRQHLSLQEALWHGMDFVFSCIVLTGLFAMIFKTLPQVYIRWKDVWVGAAVTAGLFTIGKLLVGFYIGKGALISTFGAAGSFVAILIWVYYSALVLYGGAEFTKAYADFYNPTVAKKNSHQIPH